MKQKINLEEYGSFISSTQNKKNVLDYIDNKIIDQLHNSVLQFSNATTKCKELMLVAIGLFVPIAFKEGQLQMQQNLFFSFLTGIIILFWLTSAYAYYYQQELRIRIEEKIKSIKQRANIQNQESEIISKKRQGYSTPSKVVHSIFNMSNFIYIILLIVVFIVYLKKNNVFHHICNLFSQWRTYF